MNIFVIPSWYPSIDYPINGIMVYEQTKALCEKYPEINVGISIWGQQEEQYLLKAVDHIKNLYKIASADLKASTKVILPNLKEYHKPTFTWTNKIANGNLHSIVEANIFNLLAFEKEYGKVDLIHAQVNHPAGRIALKVAREMNLPYCITERMSPFPCQFSSDAQGKLKRAWQIPYIHSFANLTISPAQRILMQKQGINNIHVIPNFVDEDFFCPSESRSASSAFTFLTLTSAIPRKGIDVLLKAIKIYTTLDQSPDTIFRIGGIGSMTLYKNMAESLDITKSIVWLEEANREKALKEFQNCDAFVLASFEESFGNVYAEAIACGKPIIATKCGGPESIVNATNGFLVEKNDEYELAQAMHTMAISFDRYDSKSIRQDFLDRFSKKAVLPQLYQFYKEVAKSKPVYS